MIAAALAGTLLMPDFKPQTYCNPIDIDYGYTPIPNFSDQGRHRATADPVIVVFRGDYYLFSTNQWGYWWSSDMSDWKFVPRRFLKPWHKVYDELCAPAAWVQDDALYVIGSTYAKNFPIWKSTNPKVDEWKEAIEEFPVGAWDPAFFLDDDGRLYCYHGSSNDKPLWGLEVDPKTLLPLTENKALISLNPSEHGWERFGETQDNTFLNPFMEGAWMTKHKGRYYLQYGAPGTEFSGYGDGVYVADAPLGPFTYQDHNPFSFKPGGFARGAGHGATYQDPHGQWWHVSTIAIGVKNNFERRNGIWPTYFDQDGIMRSETAFGDYPHYLPGTSKAAQFTGWMLLNYAKPVQASSTLGGFSPNFAVDEDIKTYWSARTGGEGEWFQTDLGEVCEVRAIQVNAADQDAEHLGKIPGLKHRFRLLSSRDGKRWKVFVDRSLSTKDAPHAYIELPKPIQARFIKIENLETASGKFALSGLRVFGKAAGSPPPSVQKFIVLRGDSERRNAWAKWQAEPLATGYLVRSGIAKDKLYTSHMVYGANELYIRYLDKSRPYWFSIQAFSERGLSAPTEPVLVE